MGNCVTIEVNPNNTKSQNAKSIANHKHKSKSKASGPGSRQKSKQELLARKKKGDESSDEETSMEDEHGHHHHHNHDHDHFAAEDLSQYSSDPNFGKVQSPINVVTCPDHPYCVKPMKKEEFVRNPLRFNYPDEVRGCTILNTGHTVQVNIPDHAKCTCYINNKIYTLKQFHFHTPSEHTIDSKQYEMEMHLVHINEEGEIAVLGFIFTTKQQYFKPTLKLTKSRKYLVKKTQAIIKSYGANKDDGNDDEHPIHQNADADDVDIDIDEDFDADADDVDNDKTDGNGEEDRRRSSASRATMPGNDFLAQFWDELPLKKTEEDIRLSMAISFDYLFETAAKNYQKSVENNEIVLDMQIFEYTGSLTTPPFSEGVHWMLSKETHFINVKQLNKLSSCWGHHNNARDVQQMHGRQVQVRNHLAVKGYFMG